MKPITRVFMLPREVHPRAEPDLLHEWPLHIRDTPEGTLLFVGNLPYRVRYRSVIIDEVKGEVVVSYVVQDAHEEPRI